MLLTPDPDNFPQTRCGAVSYKGVLDYPINFYNFYFMQLFVTILGEISTEIPSSRTILGHKVHKTKCDLRRCDFVCQFYALAFSFFLVPLLSNNLPALIKVM